MHWLSGLPPKSWNAFVDSSQLPHFVMEPVTVVYVPPAYNDLWVCLSPTAFTALYVPCCSVGLATACGSSSVGVATAVGQRVAKEMASNPAWGNFSIPFDQWLQALGRPMEPDGAAE